MKKFWAYIKEHKIRFILLSLTVFLLVLFIILRNIEAVAEFWARSFGRYYQTVIGSITSIVPFSVFELLIIAAIVYAISWIAIFVRKTRRNGFHKSSVKLVDLLLVITTVLTLYVGTAGMIYHRKDIDFHLRDTSTVEQSKYYDISLWLTEELNEAASKLDFEENGSVKRPYSYKKLYEKIGEEYSKIDGDYLTKFTAKPKQLLLFGWLYTELNISGISFLPTGEANFNQNVPSIDIPFVIAHEIAHTKGVMDETFANDVAMYVCLNSSDPYIKYSALCNAYDSIAMMAMTINDDNKLNEFYSLLDQKVWKDFSYSNDFWDKHTFFKDLSEWFNNLYLKIFGNQTTEAYRDNTDEEIVIIDDEPVFVLNSLSNYQQIVVDYWLKENGI